MQVPPYGEHPRVSRCDGLGDPCQDEEHRPEVDGVALRHDGHFLLHGAPTQDGFFEGLRTLFLVAVLT